MSSSVIARPIVRLSDRQRFVSLAERDSDGDNAEQRTHVSAPD
jgi:hypothetical protein